MAETPRFITINFKVLVKTLALYVTNGAQGFRDNVHVWMEEIYLKWHVQTHCIVFHNFNAYGFCKEDHSIGVTRMFFVSRFSTNYGIS